MEAAVTKPFQVVDGVVRLLVNVPPLRVDYAYQITVCGSSALAWHADGHPMARTLSVSTPN